MSKVVHGARQINRPDDRPPVRRGDGAAGNLYSATRRGPRGLRRDTIDPATEVCAVADPRALVIGGTGPTGPFVVEGLHERGFEVTILHGGQHEVEFAVPDVRHIHEDPHFQEPLERGIGRETFDLVVAQYGRLRIIAEVLKGRTERLVAVGGATGIFAPEGDERWGATGKPALFSEPRRSTSRERRRGRRAQDRPAHGRGDEHAVREPRRRCVLRDLHRLSPQLRAAVAGSLRLVGHQARA